MQTPPPEMQRYTTVRRQDRPDVVVVSENVVSNPLISMADLGLYVRLAHYIDQQDSGADLETMLRHLLNGELGKRVDISEQELRAGIQRLADAGYLGIEQGTRPPYGPPSWPGGPASPPRPMQ